MKIIQRHLLILITCTEVRHALHALHSPYETVKHCPPCSTSGVDISFCSRYLPSSLHGPTQPHSTNLGIAVTLSPKFLSETGKTAHLQIREVRPSFFFSLFCALAGFSFYLHCTLPYIPLLAKPTNPNNSRCASCHCHCHNILRRAPLECVWPAGCP